MGSFYISTKSDDWVDYDLKKDKHDEKCLKTQKDSEGIDNKYKYCTHESIF